jgi:hypothetical protein
LKFGAINLLKVLNPSENAHVSNMSTFEADEHLRTPAIGVLEFPA